LVCNMGLTSPYQMTGLNPTIFARVRVPTSADFSHVQSSSTSSRPKKSLGVDENIPTRGPSATWKWCVPHRLDEFCALRDGSLEWAFRPWCTRVMLISSATTSATRHGR
jgi:hypothetical protein